MKKPNSPHRKARTGNGQGVALLAVLWLVAALSIMIAGMLHVVRSEVHIASQSRNSVINNALAEAAIRLVLQELVFDKNKATRSIQTKTIVLFGSEVKVEVIPLNGSIDLNNAPSSLLADAFEYGGGTSKQEAQRMATSVIEARGQKDLRGTPVRFHAIEDLLRLNGLDYDIYARLKNVFTVDIVGSGRVNPLAASMSTLVILAKGDHTRAQQLLESRLSNSESMDTTTLTAAHIEMVPSSFFSIRATLPMQDNVSLVRTWRVDTASPAYGLPWRVLGVDQSALAETRLVK